MNKYKEISKKQARILLGMDKVYEKLMFAEKPVLVVGSGLSRLPDKTSNIKKISMIKIFK